MKQYQVFFEVRNGLVVGITTVEAKNMKEARSQAQAYNRNDLLVFLAKGVKTIVLPEIKDKSVLDDLAFRGAVEDC